MNLIDVKNLFISYDDTKVLKGVSFTLKQGECLGLIGGSGEGKSTLLRAIIRLETPTSGRIEIEGENVMRFSRSELITLRKKISYVFQEGALFDSMTVYENLAFPLIEHQLCAEEEMNEKVMYELEEFSLTECADKYPSALSGGMKKRVGIARATISKPKAVLYDEPTAGLDPYKSRNMQNTISTLQKRGTSSMIVTHDMQTALQVCDRIALLKDGKIQAVDTPQNFRKSYNTLLNNFIHGIRE